MLSSTSLTINLPKYLFNTSHDRAGNSTDIDRQIHLKSLALYAADWYLQCLQFETRHDDRDDWWIPYLAQSAPLEIIKIGNIECIPVVSDTRVVTISPDLKDDRIGYLFVRLDESLTSAEIIGFSSEYNYLVELDRLQSTDDLIDYLCDLESQSKLDPVIKMADWFAGICDGIWRDLNTLPLTPAYRSRQQQEGSLSVKSVERGQEIKLGDADDSPIVILTIRSEQMDEVNSDITLQLSPKLPAATLPIDLKFIVRDDRGEEISSFESKAGDCYGEIVLDNGKEGEQFSLEIEFDRVEKIGTFEVGYRNHAGL
jgi:Protein of unknown function (DUF1822)